MRYPHRTLGPVLLVSAAVCAQPASAQTTYHPCSLVTASEAEALTGQKVTKSDERDIPYKKDARNDHDGVISMCGHSVSPVRGVQLVVSSSPVTPEGKARGAAAAKAAVESAKKLGAKVEERKFGAITCSTVQLTGDMERLSGTSCGAEKGPLFFAVTVTAGPTGFVPIDQLHALAEKILARLP
jgi:hypothetical protein